MCGCGARVTIAVVGSRTGVQRCRTSGASTVRWGCTVDGDGSTARRWQHSSRRRWQHNTAMAALQVVMAMQVTEPQSVMTAKIDAALMIQQPCHTRM
mmetsp:Transcript_56675/g.77266  ORF Transcript_56675/g.77266 Transcript_56675/m.77266 type:complete len:97 (+) Transcript_56675:97-387(+)